MIGFFIGLSLVVLAVAMVLAILAHLERIWPQPDEGIWEVRGGPRHFTYSKVMAWVAFDRAVRSVIAEAGYGDAFLHRTGHSLGTRTTHGDAAHLDDEVLVPHQPQLFEGIQGAGDRGSRHHLDLGLLARHPGTGEDQDREQ